MLQLRPLWTAGLIVGVGLALLAGIGCTGQGGEDAGGESGNGVQPDKKIPGIRSELVASAADGVTAMAFAPDGRLFFTEINTGNVRIITPQGELLPDPFAHVDLAMGQESTLQGIAIDPEFQENHYVYVYFSEAAERAPNFGSPVLLRFTAIDNTGTDPTVLVKFPPADPEIPLTLDGRIHFGPDGYLYISVGDYRDTRFEQLAQDLSSPFGKILRVTRDGEAVPDNPFVDRPSADPRVYAYGLRNTGDFTFDAESGLIYAGDRGDLNCDELNIIEAGKNYGWPRSLDTGGAPCQNPGGIEPMYHFSLPGKEPQEIVSTVGPMGIEFVSGQEYPALGDGLLVCEVKTNFMRRLQLAGPDKDQVTDDSVVVEDCHTALAAGPEGIIYYSNGVEIRRLPPQ